MSDSAGALWPAGVGLRVLEETDSTMAEAGRWAPELTGPAWVLALHQARGRGRRGRAWAIAAGNLAATLVLPVTGGPGQAALRSFVAALALHQALLAVTGRPEALALKWPNDVLLHGGKVAGILLESLPGGWLAIGIGVNLAAAPTPAEVEPDALRPVALAAETGVRIAPRDFLPHLAAAFAEWEARFLTEGFAPIRTAWLARAARLGQRITVRTGTATLQGVFETVDAQGQLVLCLATGRRAIPAADVYF